MFAYIWNTFLYQPLFNVLIYFYNTVAHQNLGWAVVWLTISLRVVMLPLTIISEMNAGRHKKAEEEAVKVAASFKGDAVAQKEAFRKVMRTHRISPWAKATTLFIQALVLVLLYQVFIRGINGDKVFKILYTFIDFPGKINTVFYGFEIGKLHD